MKKKFRIDQTKCTFCAGCASVCPTMAIVIHDHDSTINAKCISCGICERFCPLGAVEIIQEDSK